MTDLSLDELFQERVVKDKDKVLKFLVENSHKEVNQGDIVKVRSYSISCDSPSINFC